MSIFSRALAVLAPLRRVFSLGQEAQARQSLSLVSSGTQLVGSIETPGSLRIEGHLQGDVRVKGVVEVVKGASVVGSELHCQELIVAGRIESNVFAAASVTVVPGGCLRGDLTCRDLQAARGAEFQGHLTLGESTREPAARAGLAFGNTSAARDQTLDAFV